MNKIELLEQTLVIIKPDAVSRNLIGEIISRFETNGLSVVKIKSLRFKKTHAMSFYIVHIDKPFYESLIDFMASDLIVVLLLEGKGAIEQARRIIGVTDPALAEPGTIRGDYGFSIERNSAHASDSPETAEWDINFFFPDDDIASVNETYLIGEKAYINNLIKCLDRTNPGKKRWKQYEDIMCEIIYFLFSDDLQLPKKQATPRYSNWKCDLVLYNVSKSGFWHEMRDQHSANPVVFEFKNKKILNREDINQISGYLEDLKTSFGIITSRKRQNYLFYTCLSKKYHTSNQIIINLYDSLIKKLLISKSSNKILRGAYMNQFFKRKDKL